MRQASSCGVRGSWDSSRVEAGNGPSSPDEVTNTGLLSTLVGTSAFNLSCDGDPGPPFVA